MGFSIKHCGQQGKKAACVIKDFQEHVFSLMVTELTTAKDVATHEVFCLSRAQQGRQF